MENQIQRSHDMTSFWLEAKWRTSREKRLEKQVIQLTQENDELKGRLSPLKVFENIPCNVCGKPLGTRNRNEVLEIFKNWHHGNCRKG
jgi:hypothetical protein